MGVGGGLNTVEQNVDLQGSHMTDITKKIKLAFARAFVHNIVDCTDPGVKRIPPFLSALLYMLGSREHVLGGLEHGIFLCAS